MRHCFIRPLAAIARSALACVLLAVGLAGAVAATTPEDPPFATHPAARNVAHWNLRAPEGARVVFQGEASFEGVSMGTQSMMYGPGPVAALAGLVTHGLLLAGGQSHQKTKVQEAADQVLIPYQAVLADFSYAQLLQRGGELMNSGGTKSVVLHGQEANTDWTIDSSPVYSITQDQRALVLDNTIWISEPGEPAEKRHPFTVRVVDRAIDAPDPTTFWIDNAGERLKDASARMFARSLDIAVGIFSGATPLPAPAFHTVRYRQGGTQKMERAQLILAGCDSLLLKSLRGWFLLVPATAQSRDPALDATCAPAATGTGATPPPSAAPQIAKTQIPPGDTPPTVQGAVSGNPAAAQPAPQP